MENYIFDTCTDQVTENKVYVLIIYDIINNKKRTQLAKFLQGYGFRIQKSAFEAMIDKKLYHKLLREIRSYADEQDSIRVYKIIGKGQVTKFGKVDEEEMNDVIII